MKRNSVLIILISIAVIVSIYFSFRESAGEGDFKKEIEKDREEKDAFMRSSPESPFADNPKEYKGLSYYPPDMKYRIIADLIPVTDKKVVVLATSDGNEQRYIEYAHATFDFGGFHNSILILEGMDIGPIRGKLFLGFADETSANETYGGGRYLDIPKVPGSKTVTLDFNKAYNPYCAYIEKYSCPLPPAENVLHVAIAAGEKTYEH